MDGLSPNWVLGIFAAVSKRNTYRIASILIILSVFFSQLGLKFLHTHQGNAPKASITIAAQPDNGSNPCPACSMDGTTVLYSAVFCIPLVAASSPTLVAPFLDDVRLPVSGPSLGRAPPVA